MATSTPACRAGKLKRAHQPGSRHSGDSGSHGNAKQQKHRLEQCYGQHIGGEVRPEISVTNC
ncbi:MAG: hypothetical protein WA710_18425, partial [Pseudolabrys sp.]